jgi:hypothetical protein
MSQTLSDASILTNAAAALDLWRAELIETERLIAVLVAKADMLREHIADVEGKPRPRRGRAAPGSRPFVVREADAEDTPPPAA